MLTTLIAAAMIAATPQADVPQLREDNIKEVISVMTPEEKCALIVGGRAKNFNGIGFTNQGIPGAFPASFRERRAFREQQAS